MAETFVKEFEDWLLMDRWSVLQSCMILSGYFYKELGNSNSALIRISNGQKVKPQSNLSGFKRVSGLWAASEHPVWEKSKRDGVPIFKPVSADVNDIGKVRPCYVINWAAKKSIEIPWLIEAKEMGFKVGKPAPNEEPVALVARESIGERKEGNLYSLIGLLKDFLTGGEENLLEDQKDGKPLFKNQSELINYIDGTYGESNPGKGMKTAELKKVFAKAKQHRKDIQ
jgi:hypothetical protein